ncbi:hypothetical protein [Halorhabdus sp. CUG00001]|uniref:hypothetical protein n=1 Tax=Halorhabdus sp. CUG00001 TaxID=2600297 RepID=UPI00131B7832|nr:hypothetical protein [Halorhabdus sp. CUG00001]
MKTKPILLTMIAVVILFTGCVSTFASDSTNTATNGEMTAMNVSKAVTDSDSTYIPENDSVRYRSAVKQTDEDDRPTREQAEYSVVSFETWGDSEAASLAAEGVREKLSDQFPDALERVEVLVSHDGDHRSITVAYVVNKDADGDIINTPDFGFDTLVSKTPSEITATVSLDGNQYTATYDVTVERMELTTS